MQLYLHVPFCRSKCRYCDFASWAGHEDQMAAYTDAIIQEAQHETQLLGNEKASVETIFVGGGTPSTMPSKLFGEMLGSILSLFAVHPQA